MNTNGHEAAANEAKGGERNPWPRFSGRVRLTVGTEDPSLYSWLFVVERLFSGQTEFSLKMPPFRFAQELSTHPEVTGRLPIGGNAQTSNGEVRIPGYLMLHDFGQ